MNNIAERYQNDGFIVKRAVFSEDEVNQFREETNRLRNDPNFINEKNLRASTREVDGEGRIVDRLDPIIDISPLFKALSEDERIHATLRDIFGEPALLMKDKLISEDDERRGEEIIQKLTDQHVKEIDGLLETKEKDLMSV